MFKHKRLGRRYVEFIKKTLQIVTPKSFDIISREDIFMNRQTMRAYKIKFASEGEKKSKEVTVVPIINSKKLIIFDFDNEVSYEYRFDSNLDKIIKLITAKKNDEYGWLYMGTFGAYKPIDLNEDVF